MNGVELEGGTERAGTECLVMAGTENTPSKPSQPVPDSSKASNLEGEAETSAAGWHSGLGLRKLAKEWAEKNQNVLLEGAKKMWGNLKIGDKDALQEETEPHDEVENVHDFSIQSERRVGRRRNRLEQAAQGTTRRPDSISDESVSPTGLEETSEAARPAHPWSPVTKPIAQAFNDGFLKPGKVMGKRLAEVWDIHDLFDDGRCSSHNNWQARIRVHILESMLLFSSSSAAA